YGKPLAFYSDKASVFRINNKQATGGDGLTQFGRAMNELNITGICANTSSAKGRVERAHLTLQDRLVKELRLRGISTPEAANAFAEEFMADYNRRAGEKITVFDYPDGSIAFRHLHRPLAYQVFDTLACVDQGAVVDNKRLGAVPRLAQ